MGYLFALVTIALYLFYVFMLLRMLFDWVRMFAPGWRPKGIALLCASAVYAVTDWPMEKLRRVIPPVRVGNVALDTGFLILIVVVSMLLGPMMSLTARFSYRPEPGCAPRNVTQHSAGRTRLTGYTRLMGHGRAQTLRGSGGRGRCAMRIFCCLYDRNPGAEVQ